jgi:hypothetical protein
MSAELFEWKSAGRGPRYEVSIDDATLRVARDGQALDIQLAEIERVYVQPIYSPPVSHMLHVEIVDARGRGVAFHDSGFGPPDTDAAACVAAASALLRGLEKRPGGARIYHGQRPDKPGRFLIAGAILLGFVALTWAVLHFLFDKPDHARGLAIVLSACFVFGALWSARKARRQVEVEVRDMLGVLESL